MEHSQRMPALFAGQDGCADTDAAGACNWQQLMRRFPAPRGIVCIGAQWHTQGICIGASPATDDEAVPRPGAMQLADDIARLLDLPNVRTEDVHALDQEMRCVVQAMYPGTDIPLVQLSLDSALSALEHAALGAWLRPLRQQGVLILGIGNLPLAAEVAVQSSLLDAARVDELIDHNGIVQLAESEDLEAAEHALLPGSGFLPLLYTLAVREADDSVHFLNNDAGATCALLLA